ncbi:hypothetical protein LWI29_032931 [Acer saccharum]|uniref:PGG domain-containing protein n=1 Tax=Acer saccharum TaxID=4024 RepID=A0AA39RFT5_ACESA|nr:hypothetical protein LWI29_032931 [Acer saccharum]
MSTLGRTDQKDWMLEKLLLSSRAKHAKDVIGSTHMATTSTTMSQRNNAPIVASRSNLRCILKLEWIQKKTAPLMIVATLIATVSLAHYISPPGGVWEETKSGHLVGTSIFLDNHPKEYLLFIAFDITAFISSCFIILLLISGLPLGADIWCGF